MTNPASPQNAEKEVRPQTLNDLGILRTLVGHMHTQRIFREVALKQKLKVSAVPLPPDPFEEVAQFSPLQLDEVMVDHPGRKVCDIESLYPQTVATMGIWLPKRSAVTGYSRSKAAKSGSSRSL